MLRCESIETALKCVTYLLHYSAKDGVKLLEALTGKPHEENPGKYPAARGNKMAFSDPIWWGPGLAGRLLNNRQDIFAFCSSDVQWHYDSSKFKGRRWHKDLFENPSQESQDPPYVYVDLEVCHIPNLVSVDIFFALAHTDEVEIFRSPLVRGLVQHAWWPSRWQAKMDWEVLDSLSDQSSFRTRYRLLVVRSRERLHRSLIPQSKK